jgi:hypothetical protein
LVFATDTGLTAALGLVRGHAYAPRLEQTRVAWFIESKEYFLPDAWVREALPSSCGSFTIQTAPPVHHPERAAEARQVLKELLEEEVPDSVFLSGDGTVLYPLAEQLAVAGVPQERVRLECFFNNPQRRAP